MTNTLTDDFSRATGEARRNGVIFLKYCKKAKLYFQNKNKIEKEQRVVVKGGGWDREEEQIGGTQETFRPVKLLCKI